LGSQNEPTASALAAAEATADRVTELATNSESRPDISATKTLAPPPEGTLQVLQSDLLEKMLLAALWIQVRKSTHLSQWLSRGELLICCLGHPDLPTRSKYAQVRSWSINTDTRIIWL